MKNSPSKFFRLMIMLTIVSLFVSSVVFAERIKSIKRDQISPKAQSIVFGRIRIISDKPGFNPLGKVCRFNLWSFTSNKKLPDFPIIVKSKCRIKSSSDDAKGYDIPFFAEAEAGKYIFGYCGYEIHEYLLSDIASTADSIGNGHLTGLYFNILKSCMIPTDSLVYLGVIEIRLTDIYFEGNDIKINSYSTITNNDYEKDLNNFQSNYPKLYDQFKDNVVKGQWFNLKN